MSELIPPALPGALPVDAGAPRMATHALRGFERVAVPVATWVNTNRPAKWLIQQWVRWVSCTGVVLATWRLWDLRGLERLPASSPGAVILVSNHRSFFDMYVASAVLYWRTSLLARLFFPVRANFFYDNPLGAVVNLIMSGFAMWPPVFRDDRRELNATGLRQMLHVLDGPGAVLGIHPEGTRGKGPDPYVMLPAKPGVGRLVQGVPPDTLVIPFFIIGLSDAFLWEVRRGWLPRGRRGPDIRITFGDPVRAGDLAGAGDAQAISERLAAVVAALGDEDRARNGSREP